MLEMSDTHYRRTGSYKILVGDRCIKQIEIIENNIKIVYQTNHPRQSGETSISKKKGAMKIITSAEVIKRSLAEKSLAESKSFLVLCLR